MKFGSFVLSHAPTCSILAVVVTISAFVLFVAGVSVSIIVFTAIIEVLGTLAALAIDWTRKKRFFEDLEACTSEVDHPLWMTEMVERPEYLEGAIIYDALGAIAHAANDDVAEYRRQVADYREYIETWVHEAKSPLAASASYGRQPAGRTSCRCSRREGRLDR